MGPCLGFELEVDTRYSSSLTGSAEWLAPRVETPHVLWCKHDGSLYQGFEVVSHPATLLWHKAAGYKEKWDFLLVHGLRSKDAGTCGLHVHIDRGFLSESQWAAMSDWINNYYRFITDVSGRDSGYARFYNDIDPYDMDVDWSDEADIDEDEGPTEEDVRKQVIEGRYRYAALNFCNTDTIELRTFIGTLNYNRFLATLEFADALSRIFKLRALKDPSIGEAGGPSFTPALFVAWVRRDPERYGELVMLFDKLGY